MAALGGGAVSYERGTPVGTPLCTTPFPQPHFSRKRSNSLLKRKFTKHSPGWNPPCLNAAGPLNGWFCALAAYEALDQLGQDEPASG